VNIEMLIPDVAVPQAPKNSDNAASIFTRQYEQAASVLDHAQEAERDFAEGHGGLLAMTTARATADIALSTAVAIASRISQCASTLGNMSL
jgi:flagellar hook-basal body complex protein FliE